MAMKIKKRHTILLVDDDPDDLELFTEAIKNNNPDLNVVHAFNGREAIDLLSVEKDLPCLIIMDMNMPVLNGKETIAAIKKLDSLHSIPIVVLTTSASETDQKYCDEFTVGMVTKPS